MNDEALTPDIALGITITIIPQSERDEFDENFRSVTSMTTPLPPASDAFVATDSSSGDVLGAAYIHIRHHMGPYVLADGAPPETFDRLASAISDQLRSTVREALLAQNASVPAPSPSSLDGPTNLGLSYDVYVTAGHPAPDGFERLDVEVWRRRVC